MFHLTPDILEAVYETLRLTPPFRGWNLPHPDELEFRVSRHRDRLAHFDDKDGVGYMNIAVSSRFKNNLLTLHPLIAHEMVHLHERQLMGAAKWAKAAPHGRVFMRLAAQVCKHHDFELETF